MCGAWAGANNNLQSIPDAWRASRISCFLSGRADWALLASVFPCLWEEVAEKSSTKGDCARTLALVKSEAFLRVVQNFRRTHGIAPHPAVALKIAEDHAKNDMNSPRRRAAKKQKVSVA